MRRSRIETSSSRQKIGLPCRRAGLVLVFTSLICFGAFFSYKNAQPALPEIAEEVSSDLYPMQIIIPKVKISLPVLPKELVNGEWDIPSTSAAYLLGSGLPGQPGNPVIYGHNKNKLLGPLRWLEKDDEIKLVNQKSQEFIYLVTETKTVAPKTVDILAPTQEAFLTLYTCTGPLDTQRFVVVAKLKGWSQ